MTLEAVGVCSGTVLSGSPPRNMPFAKALLAWVPPDRGMGKCCRLVAINWNSKFKTRTWGVLPSASLQGSS